MDTAEHASSGKRSWLADSLGRWSMAVTGALLSLFPLTVLGAILLALSHLPWPGALAGSVLLRQLLLATTGLMGLACAIATAAQLFHLRGKGEQDAASRPTVALVAASLFLLTLSPLDGITLESLGYSAIFRGIVTGLVAAELMAFFNRRLPSFDIATGLQQHSPLSLHTALRLTLATALTVLVFTLLWLGAGPLLAVLGQVLAGLLEWVMQAAWLPPVLRYGLFALCSQLLWLLGINGGQVLLALGSSGDSFVAAPEVLYSSTQASPMFVYVFAQPGGAGATWGLLLAILLFGRDAMLRRLALFSLLPALFNVNELLLFGIPLVFGRAFLLPFLLTPVLLLMPAVLLAHSGLLPLAGSAVGWSTPVLFSGYLMTGSAAGALLQVSGICIAALVYLPWLRQLEQQRRRDMKVSLQQTLRDICHGGPHTVPLVERQDPTGAVARALLSDFRRDLHIGRVCLHYQPQHDHLLRVVGVEALLRWKHGEHGPIPAQAIVNIMEDAGRIDELGDWALQQACCDALRWQAQGIDTLKISVNVSPLELDQPGYAQRALATLARYPLSPGRIVLEITEGRSFASSEASLDNLQQLAAAHVPLSMDDFGAGHTSLVYLRKYAMHTIKLDHQITHDVLHNPVNQEIVRSMALLTASQGALLVAEFVDTTEQQQLLARLGCNWFQGWLFSAALPADTVPAYLLLQEAAGPAFPLLVS